MVLQHFWHPQQHAYIQSEISYQFYKDNFKSTLLLLEKEIDGAVASYIEQHLEHRDLCPKCSSINFKPRKKKTPLYRCNHCTFEFDEPVHGEYIGGNSREDIRNDFSKKMVREYIWNAYNEKIRKEAILESIRQHKRYLSCTDTKTFCKKCAFMWDKNGMKLCDHCKNHYHKQYNDKCAECIKKETGLTTVEEIGIYRMMQKYKSRR